MLHTQGYRKHITALHPSIERELILPIGSWVATPDVFGNWQIGRITSYGISSDYAEELRGVKKYVVEGWDATKLGRVERSEQQIFIIAQGA